MRRTTQLLVIGILTVWHATSVFGQTRPPAATDDDHAIVFELGWAGSYSHGEGLHARGATFAFEVTPVPDRLELESGVTLIRANGSTETSIDLLFKKPWTLSRTVEFMAGVGPEIGFASGSDSGTFWGVSAVGDLMFWPRKNLGWYLEPGYEADVRNGATRSGFAIAGGLIIGR